MLTPWDPAEMRTEFCRAVVVVGAPLQIPLTGLVLILLPEPSVAVVKQHLETWFDGLKKPLCVKGQSLAKSLLCSRKSQLFSGSNKQAAICSSVHPWKLSPSVCAHVCYMLCFPLSQEMPAFRFWDVPVSLCHSVALAKRGQT